MLLAKKQAHVILCFTSVWTWRNHCLYYGKGKKHGFKIVVYPIRNVGFNYSVVQLELFKVIAMVKSLDRLGYTIIMKQVPSTHLLSGTSPQYHGPLYPMVLHGRTRIICMKYALKGKTLASSRSFWDSEATVILKAKLG